MEQGRREIKPPPQHPPENQPPNHPPPLPRKCPRCDSANTKFCYYNNYSLSQPRYFCKGCRRYWTQGGTLRNVPVGGGCRKAKRLKTASSPAVGNVTPQQPQPPPVGPTPYYPGGGFLSPLAAMNSFSQPHTTPLGSSSSGFSLFQGFNLPPLSQPQTEFYQTMSLVQPNRPLGFWNQALINSSNSNSSNPNPCPMSGTSLNLNPFHEFPGYDPSSS